MKSGKPISPFLFTFYSHFAAIHRASRDIPATAAKAFGQRGRITFGTQRAVSWLELPTSFRSLLAACGVHASGGTGLPWRDRANPGAPTFSLAYPETVHNPSSNRKTDTGLCRETTTTNVTGSRFIGEH